MARRFINGLHAFESATYPEVGVDGQTGATITWDTTIKRSGGNSLKVITTADGLGSFRVAWSNWGKFVRMYVRITSLPTAASALMGYLSGDIVRLNPDGTLTLFVDGFEGGTSVTALTDSSRWYRLELAGDYTALRIDGVEEIFCPDTSFPVTQLELGGCADIGGDSYTAYFADIVCDSADWPGESHVVLALPVADVSNSGWTGGAGGTSNLWDAINNTPPVGVASASETNTSNIECAVKDGSDHYVVELTHYDDLGIGADDEIVAFFPIVIHGEDINTGTKSVTIASNANGPSFTWTSVVMGDDLGAHLAYGSGTTTYWRKAWMPDPWGLPASGITDRSAGYQIAFDKTDGTTRTACICFVGCYIEYRHPAPTISLDLPLDAATGVVLTPDLKFTGENDQSDQMEYEVQLDTTADFDSQNMVVKYVDVAMGYVGTPTDNLYAELRSGSRTGTLLGTSNDVAGSTVGKDYVRFTFSTPVSLTPDTTYYLIIERDGARDTVNYYGVYGSTNSLYASGGMARRDSGVWGSESTTSDLDVRFYNENGVLELALLPVEGIIYTSYSYDYLYGGSGTYEASSMSFVAVGHPKIRAWSWDHSGFSGGASHPYASGTQVTYTVPSSLDLLTTYYWRARARKALE